MYKGGFTFYFLAYKLAFIYSYENWNSENKFLTKNWRLRSRKPLPKNNLYKKNNSLPFSPSIVMHPGWMEERMSPGLPG